MNVVSDPSVAPFSFMSHRASSRYQWLLRASEAWSVGGRPALLILLVTMFVVSSGCATVEDAALHTPKTGESTHGGSLPREAAPESPIPNRSASLPMSVPAQTTVVDNDLSASVVDESSLEWKSSDLIVRTKMRLRVSPIMPLPDAVSIWDAEIGSLRSPVVRALGDDLAPIRPPLRQSWAYHRTVRPEGYDMELSLPHSVFSASGEHVSSGPLRNTYAGFRDQPLLHPEPASLPAEQSNIPEMGPPPPHHAAKTITGFLTATLVGGAVYAFAPNSLVGGSTHEGQYERSWNRFKEAWTKPPVWDQDSNGINYVGHPYFGALFYLTQRNYDESPLRSFLTSVVMSTGFEYLVESWSERPSIQDLIVTPIVGSILGELVYLATKEMKKNGFTTAEKIIVTVINPMYVFQNGYR